MAAKWQYRNDEFKFVDFTKQASTALEKAWARNDAAIKLDIRGHAYSVDMKHFTQLNEVTKRERLIRRVDADPKTGGKHIWGRGPQWEWESHHGTFTPYDPVTNDVIELAFMKDDLRAHVKLDVSAHEKKGFVIHFGHMHQENEDATGVRRVRRVIRDIAPPDSTTAAEDAVKDEKPSRQAALLAAAATTKKRAREDDGVVAAARPVPSPTVAGIPASAGAGSVPLSAVLPALNEWQLSGSVMVLPIVYGGAKPTVVKIAGFDMDDTLVMPPSGATFAKSRADWKWLCPEVVPKLQELHNSGYRVVIFSNQSGIGNKGWDEKKASDIKGKIVDLSAACKVPIGAVIATKEDEFRKPCTAMWDTVYTARCCPGATIDLAQSFYCGDAAGRTSMTLAGRKKDFSCSDRKFANNLGVPFTTPEEFFKGEKPQPFHWDGLGPADLAAVATHYPQAAYHAAHTELVIMVGFPGCGKSTFYHRFFAPHGYMHVNRDTLKTPEKCISAADTYLSQKKSVVVDNTNPSADDRKRYTAVAKKYGVPVRCVVMQHDAALANHMNIMRSRLGLCARVSSIAFNMFKSKYEAVDATKEGIAEVISVPPVADFTGLPARAKEFFYQLS